MRFCCCQIQLFQSLSGASAQILGRGADLKRSATVLTVLISNAMRVSLPNPRAERNPVSQMLVPLPEARYP